jgi:hypothetical protein
MPPVRTKRRIFSRKKVEEQRVSPSRGCGRRNMQRTSPNTEEESTPDAILNVTGPSSLTGKTIELSATSGESVIDIPLLNTNFLPLQSRLAEQDYQPPQIPSHFDPVSVHVPFNIKQKIWQNKFIDLSILLKSARDLQDSADSQGDIRIHNGQLCLVKQKSNVFLNIDKWTSAFIVFASVLFERFPSKLQEIFKYLRDIRLAANRSSCW